MLAVPALVVVLAAFSQAVTGFGFALIAVPLLSVVVGPQHAVVSVTAIAALLAGTVAVRHRDAVDVAAARTFVLTGLLGAPLGLAVLLLVDPATLTVLVGIVALAAVVAMLFRVRATGRRTQLGAGVLGGALLTATGMNGPPIVIGLDGRGLRPVAFRATIQVVFCTQGAVAFALFAAGGLVDRTVLGLVATYVVALPIGWTAGAKLFDRMDARHFRGAMLVMLSASAVVALGSAL